MPRAAPSPSVTGAAAPAAAPAPATAAATGAARHGWWPRVRRIGTWVFFALVAWLIFEQARTIEWDEVLTSMKAIPWPTLAGGMLLAACSFGVYSTYDLLGRHVTGHTLPARTVMGVTFISYAFNLNLGSLVGGVAFRFRLYSKLGLANDTITRVLGFSMLTNWIGYLLVAGAAFALGEINLPPGWKIGNEGLRWLGVALLATVAAYVVLCGLHGGHVLRFRGHELEVPSLRMAGLQLVMSCVNWALIGGVIWLLLQQQVAYGQVLAVLLVAAVAGVVTHVPAGLGVLEAVFVALLGHEVPQGRLLGALLAYRAVYYLLPLAIATLGFFATEWLARRRQRETA